MKKKFIYSFMIAAAAAAFSSCSNFLEERPTDAFDEETAFQSPTLVYAVSFILVLIPLQAVNGEMVKKIRPFSILPNWIVNNGEKKVLHARYVQKCEKAH